MTDLTTGPVRVFAWAAGAFVLYLVTVEAILCGPILLAGGRLVAMSSSDTIALMSGSVTSAGLAALYFQIRESARAARAAADAEKRQAASQVDNLHVAFNQMEMHRSRDLAWRYLKHLKDKPEQLPIFARSWVLGSARPAVPEPERVKSAPSYGVKDFSHYTWAISVIIAFFVRLEAHLTLHGKHLAGGETSAAIVAGPFFWSYWREGLLDIAEACDTVYNEAVEAEITVGRDPSEIIPPYFSDPLWRLERLVSAPARVRKIFPIRLDERAAPPTA